MFLDWCQQMSRIDLWRGKFGVDYTKRNDPTDQDILNRMNLWATILKWQAANYNGQLPDSILELGAGNGQNLIAIDNLYKSIGKIDHRFGAVEPNETALANLKDESIPINFLSNSDAAKVPLPDYSYDLVFTSGLLIHIPDNDLIKVMGEAYRISSKWITCIEYFSAEPREVNYRGHDYAMWTRDYGSIYLKHFKMRCLGCGFAWKPITGLDNLTFWLFEKTN